MRFSGGGLWAGPGDIDSAVVVKWRCCLTCEERSTLRGSYGTKPAALKPDLIFDSVNAVLRAVQ